MTRTKRDSIAYGVIILFSIVMLAWGIPKYTPAYPGYGASAALVPNVAVSVMLFMALLSLLTIAIAFFKKKPLPKEQTSFPEDRSDDSGFTQIGRVNLFHLAATMIPSVLFLFALEYVGYVLASIVFLIVFQYVIGSRSWVQSITVSIILTAVIYVVMRYGFSVPIPGPELLELLQLSET